MCHVILLHDLWTIKWLCGITLHLTDPPPTLKHRYNQLSSSVLTHTCDEHALQVFSLPSHSSPEQHHAPLSHVALQVFSPRHPCAQSSPTLPNRFVITSFRRPGLMVLGTPGIPCQPLLHPSLADLPCARQRKGWCGLVGQGLYDYGCACWDRIYEVTKRNLCPPRAQLECHAPESHVASCTWICVFWVAPKNLPIPRGQNQVPPAAHNCSSSFTFLILLNCKFRFFWLL